MGRMPSLSWDAATLNIGVVSTLILSSLEVNVDTVSAFVALESMTVAIGQVSEIITRFSLFYFINYIILQDHFHRTKKEQTKNKPMIY